MIVITPKINLTLYKGHLPIAWGHLEPEGGKTWLGVAVADVNSDVHRRPPRIILCCNGLL